MSGCSQIQPRSRTDHLVVFRRVIEKKSFTSVQTRVPFFTSGGAESLTPLKNAQASLSDANFLKEADGNFSTWLLHSSLNHKQMSDDLLKKYEEENVPDLRHTVYSTHVY